MNDTSSVVGSTNFLSVITLFNQLKSKGVPESDFPRGILCISDGEFDSFGTKSSTNFERAYELLRQGGFSDDYVNAFKIILWDIPNSFYGNSSNKFETFGDFNNVYYISGYSSSIISFLSNEIKTAKELFLNAMNQEILNFIEL